MHHWILKVTPSRGTITLPTYWWENRGTEKLSNSPKVLNNEWQNQNEDPGILTSRATLSADHVLMSKARTLSSSHSHPKLEEETDTKTSVKAIIMWLLLLVNKIRDGIELSAEANTNWTKDVAHWFLRHCRQCLKNQTMKDPGPGEMGNE